MKKENRILCYLKRTVIAILVMVTAFSGTMNIGITEVQAASAASQAKNAYASFLSKNVKWRDSEYRSPSELKFGLVEINNDKVPELYVYTKKWDYYYDYKLFGYVKGKVKCLYSFARYRKLGRVYPTRKIFTSVGDGLKYGSTEVTYLELKNGKVYKKASSLYSGYTGKTTYYNGSGKEISSAAFDKTLQTILAGDTYQGAPTLYNNTASNRDTKLKGKKVAVSNVKFKKGTLWGFSNGGFYLKIIKIRGNKMRLSIHMPKMTQTDIVATIDSTGKKATAKFTCEEGEEHSLKFAVSGNGVKVTEKASCYDKLLGWTTDDQWKSSITHGFYTQSHFYAE